jgi:hypothetical protein
MVYQAVEKRKKEKKKVEKRITNHGLLEGASQLIVFPTVLEVSGDLLQLLHHVGDRIRILVVGLRQGVLHAVVREVAEAANSAVRAGAI